MRKILFSVSEEMRRGDGFSLYAFDFDKLVEQVRRDYDKLSEHDKRETEYIFVTEYALEIPDDYTITTADDLALDLFNDEIECPQLSCGWFDDSAIVRQIDVI